MLKDIPIILHIPHSSTLIPEEFLGDYLVSQRELQENVNAYTDWKTDELFSFPEFPNRVVFPVSRMVCDPERYRDDADEPMARSGNGVIYTQDAFLKPLRLVNAELRAKLLERYYEPHHRRLEMMVSRCLEAFGKCLIVDCHSFSPVPLPYEPDQSEDRPDFCIGFNGGANEFPAVVCGALADYRIWLNSPYSGSMAPLKYLKDSRVQSVMIEVNRRLYKESDRLEKNSDFQRTKDALHRALEKLSERVMRD